MKRFIRNCISRFPTIGVLLMLLFSCMKDETEIPQNITPIVFNPSVNYGSMVDQDSNSYKTVTIGNKTWMAENLRVIHYRNGEPIINIQDDSQWWNCRTGAFCDYGNAPEVSETYGRLYNWYAVNDDRNIAPIGWHVATSEEWEAIISLYWGRYLAGCQLKETGITHWESPNSEIGNESGFSALPGGVRSYDGKFSYIGKVGFWWSSSETFTYYLHYKNCSCDYSDDYHMTYFNPNGCSVRCVKD